MVLSQEIDNADGSNDDDDKAFIYSSSWLAKICLFPTARPFPSLQ